MDIDPFAGGLSKYYSTSGHTAQVQAHTEGGNNDDIVTFTHKAELKLQRYELSPCTPTHTHNTQTRTNKALCAQSHENQFHPASIHLHQC